VEITGNGSPLVYILRLRAKRTLPRHGRGREDQVKSRRLGRSHSIAGEKGRRSGKPSRSIPMVIALLSASERVCYHGYLATWTAVSPLHRIH
jgi:hypothetical protein